MNQSLTQLYSMKWMLVGAFFLRLSFLRFGILNKFNLHEDYSHFQCLRCWLGQLLEGATRMTNESTPADGWDWHRLLLFLVLVNLATTRST